MIRRTRRELENNTKRLLALITDKLEELKSKLSVDKCQAMAIRSKQNNNRQRDRKSTFVRAPCFKINDRSIKITNNLKYLGLYIDNRLTWSTHILTLHSKIFKLPNIFNRIVQINFNVGKNLKLRYHVVIEKALLYGAWGGALTTEQVKRLHTIQMVFLLKLTRAFRTTSTQVLNVVVDKYEMAGSSHVWSPDIGDEIWDLKGAGIFSISRRYA
ncbi:hypothetical protein AVEN_2707-1 [Araneus ventricosus]|uniref:Reverse transcriptase domain-containing protein n=1 Tax=Araneus ventricosus TaxID=182803 RepID=A0A4Y2RIX3_ARAVE|nr:hypothetical protein AVEN_2707-1 [Araneus ventricosus]